MTNECVVCGRPTPDGYACVAETEQARQQLAEIVERVPAARDVAYRQTSGDGTGGGAVPGSRVPIDLAAGARLDAVQVALTGWARAIAEERGVGVMAGDQDLIVVAARYVSQCMEWARHKEWIDEMLREIGDCASAMRSVTAGRRERIYLGVCGAAWTDWNPDGTPLEAGYCEADLWGRLGDRKAVCRICGARHDVDERIADRTALAHSYRYSAVEIEQAYSGAILASTIRKWKQRGLLGVHGEIGGQPLYEVAEVLALVESTKERQAGHGRRETAEMGA